MEMQIPGEAAKSSDSQDMERVRELLFGGQMREVEQRIRALEEDLQAKLASVREDAEKAGDDLESRLTDKVDNVKTQLDSVKDDLDCEKEAREKALHDVSEKTRKSVEEVEKRFTKITDEMEEGKPDRSELARMFRHIASELDGDERPTAGNADEQNLLREFQTEGSP